MNYKTKFEENKLKVSNIVRSTTKYLLYMFCVLFQVAEPYYPFRNKSVEDFVIGTEKNCRRKPGFCNGSLKPGSTYRVKIRAYTDGDKFVDTAYSLPITTGERT